MRQRVATALRTTAAALLILVVGGCGRGGSAPAPAAAAKPARGGSLTASLRSQPTTFNRYVSGGGSAATDALTELTQGRLVQINRVTGELEPWLADRWTTSPDGRTYTLHLRDGLQFSDGTPLTAADVLFTFKMVYDPKVASVLASGMEVQHQPIQASSPDPRTVVLTLPAAFSPGLRLLDNLPILPRHQLEAAYTSGAFQNAWSVGTAPGTMAGLGPFVLSGYEPGQRLTFSRNQHYWRKDPAGVQLPYLDTLVIDIVPTQDAEILRMQAGSLDLMTQADLRPDDYASMRRLRDQGSIALMELGPSVDPNLLWFNLTPAAAAKPGKAYLQRPEFRQAVSFAVDRDAVVNSVYLGAATPIYGPVTPGNKTWYSDQAPKYPHDVERARNLLAGIGLTDRNHDGMLEDESGKPVRFTILTQGGHIRARVVTVIQEQLRLVGVGVDIAALDPPSIFQRFAKGDYDALYFGFQASALDPANNLDFWLSSGSSHVWNPGQAQPATPWERRIDELMAQQAAASALPDRQRLFAAVQKIFGENLPAIYFVAPTVTVALNPRVGGAQPALLDPKVLWAADQLFVARR